MAAQLFNCDVQDMPDRKTIQNINDEGHYIAKRFIASKLGESESWGINKDGTSRRKQKLLDTTVTLSSGDTMSLGFRRVAKEDGVTIAEVTKDHLQELAHVATTADTDTDTYLQDVLTNLACYMSDRASNEKKSNRLLDEWRDEVLQNCNQDSSKQIVLLLHGPCTAGVSSQLRHKLKGDTEGNN